MGSEVWSRGRVPNGYWSKRANRVKYMLWLRKRLAFSRMEDWYQLSRQDFLDHHGGGLLATMYNHSPIEALRDYAPKTDWKPWLMAKAPQGYWKDPANRRRYMTWLGKKLRFTRTEHWYNLTQEHFLHNGGDGLLANYYRNSPIDAVREFKPRVKWNEWLFAEAPQRFWQSAENRARYMTWLGKQLGYKKPDDWYEVTRADFTRHGGGALLQLGYSPLELLREVWPDEPWHEWYFIRVPNGFWKSPRNRAAYLRWLGVSYCHFTRPTDWARLTRQDVVNTGGGTLLTHYYRNSMTRLREAAMRPTAQAAAEHRAA